MIHECGFNLRFFSGQVQWLFFVCLISYKFLLWNISTSSSIGLLDFHNIEIFHFLCHTCGLWIFELEVACLSLLVIFKQTFFWTHWSYYVFLWWTLHLISNSGMWTVTMNSFLLFKVFIILCLIDNKTSMYTILIQASYTFVITSLLSLKKKSVGNIWVRPLLGPTIIPKVLD